jgi:hypothetical protein
MNITVLLPIIVKLVYHELLIFFLRFDFLLCIWYSFIKGFFLSNQNQTEGKNSYSLINSSLTLKEKTVLLF